MAAGHFVGSQGGKSSGRIFRAGRRRLKGHMVFLLSLCTHDWESRTPMGWMGSSVEQQIPSREKSYLS